ncbi:MAG: hypothetical protein OEZ41_00935 [Nitrospirota bacterium]|nr:hypothetical protein [Nitrospirota bacterium]MDH5698512.1 hypothetical protein [Nitrospirota bacterium]
MVNLYTTILSNVDPFSFSFKQKGSAFNLQEARWRSLWGSFGIVHFQAKPQESRTPQDGEHSQKPGGILDDLIDKECRWTPVLMNLGLTYKTFAHKEGEKVDTPHSETTVSRAIFQLAKAYYEEIWQSLTTDEQLALFHLTKDRFIQVEHPGLEPLLRKGLIRFEPDLRLLNASFREFVRVVGERDALHDKDAEKESSLWGSLKWPMGLGFGTILVFLIATQEELRAALPAVIALVPLLLQGLPELSGKSKT